MSKGAKKRGPSIQDVARLAGVSSQTVSRVSTGSQPVTEATRQRVLSAMKQLGYTPNHAARALRYGKFRTIGVITQKVDRTGESLTLAAIVDALEPRGYSLNLVQVQHPETEELRAASALLNNHAIDGLIIVRFGHVDETAFSFPRSLPLAVTDSRLVGLYPSAISDQGTGVQNAIDHLLQLGHKNVHHISGAQDSHPATARMAAWRHHLLQNGITPPEPFSGDWTAQSGYIAGLKVAADPSITAVFCANDEMAFGLIRALHENSRRVPEDVSVVGFDDIALGEFAAPPLTTVRQNFKQIGEELVQIVLDQIDSGTRGAPQQTHVPTELIIRGSTAPPKSS